MAFEVGAEYFAYANIILAVAMNSHSNEFRVFVSSFVHQFI